MTLLYILVFLFGLISTIIYLNREDYKYYHQVYTMIGNKKLNNDIDKDYNVFYLYYEGGYIKWYYITNYFILYIDGEQFTLRNDIQTMINPVSYYYYLKFNNWFKKHYPNLK